MTPPVSTAQLKTSIWPVTLLAAAVLLLTMGARQSLGLFLSPINSSTGLGVVAISFAMAIGQLMWGAVQPITGAVTDRYGPGRVIAAAFLLMAAGCALTPWMSSSSGLAFSLGVLFASGAGAGGFSVLITAAAQRLPAERRGFASGVINAGGSMGQFVFAPILQLGISAIGWMSTMYCLAVMSLAALPLAYALRRPAGMATPAAQNAGPGLSASVRQAFGDRSYLLLHAGFFTCGFHIAFLVTHLPSEVGLCGLSSQVASWALGIIGLANVLGSLVAGWSVQNYRSKHVLAWMYGSRAVMILLYMAAPKTAVTFYIFAAGLGFTWLATVPPTAAVVGKLFGSRYLGTLFGLTLLSHQIGGFFGAWLGGIALREFGDYSMMWWADMLLAAMAAVCNLPIREAPVLRSAAHA